MPCTQMIKTTQKRQIKLQPDYLQATVVLIVLVFLAVLADARLELVGIKVKKLEHLGICFGNSFRIENGTPAGPRWAAAVHEPYSFLAVSRPALADAYLRYQERRHKRGCSPNSFDRAVKGRSLAARTPTSANHQATNRLNETDDVNRRWCASWHSE